MRAIFELWRFAASLHVWDYRPEWNDRVAFAARVVVWHRLAVDISARKCLHKDLDWRWNVSVLGVWARNDRMMVAEQVAAGQWRERYRWEYSWRPNPRESCNR